MTPSLFTSDRKPLALGPRLGRGGEGEVYAIEGAANLAVKFYTIKDKSDREAKIRKIISDQLASKTALIAFPVNVVQDQAGKFAGFIMPRVNAHQPLHELYSPSARKSYFPQADYRFIVRTAINIACAIGATQATGCVVGDINHSGILVSKDAKVTLIDADSFQVPNGPNPYICAVGVPEYTPPELQGQRLSNVVRTSNHDAFGLAVVIFQLLFMGRHPFGGSYRQGEMPLEKAIAEYRFAYSEARSTGMAPPPHGPRLRDFPPSIGAAFEHSFGPTVGRPRATAKDWVQLLGELENSLIGCSASTLHRYPNSAPCCI